MKIHAKLDEILKQGSKIKILRFLFAEKDEHTGRGIAKGIGMSASSTYKTLQEMKGEGLISVRKKGNAILYKLQEDNYIVKRLLGPLFKKEESIYDEVISVIKRNLLQMKKKIVSIAIFGSVARKEETSKSDIDMVIIVSDKIGRIKIDKVMDKLSIDIAKKFGADIFPYILTKVEIKRKYAKKQAIIKSILDSNRLIYGEPIERILT
ncbi:MAG: nucleotidyltransferase domain-containing protein [Candidatus Omnitrophica bacterium]|nr:nucleotidyltransferase domain-containing protein [Candidatus Omnitrophota bacterium]